ncbi:hypothetical protein K439DRAFT_617203 [Ramaria rubella]|nr:hypothetical protein K439DRAFT_617203 [Ramaria rubella]
MSSIRSQPQPPTVPPQSEVEGWTVLNDEPTDDSDVSNEVFTPTNKRKTKNVTPSTRPAKNPRLSMPDINSDSTRLNASGNQPRYSLNLTSASQPTATGKGISFPSATHIPRGSSGVAKSLLNGSSVPRPSHVHKKTTMGPPFPASKPNANSSILDSIKRRPPESTSSTQANTSAKTALSQQVPAYSSPSRTQNIQRKGNVGKDRSSSSDSLPDPIDILASIGSSKEKSNAKGKGKEVDGGLFYSTYFWIKSNIQSQNLNGQAISERGYRYIFG